MPVYFLSLKHLSPLVFNAPGDTTAATHGPAVGGRGAEQPLPSTIAGMLAAEARRRGFCNPKDCTSSSSNALDVPADFHNIHECLSSLLGHNYRLYTGLAISVRGGGNGNDILVYTERGYMKPSSLDKLLREEEQEALRPLRKAYTGIALNAVTKTVKQSMLYTVEQLVPKDFYYAALIVSQSQLALPQVMRFGAEARAVHPQLLTLSNKPWRLLIGGSSTRCTTWLLNLASPALLEKTPWGKEEPVILSRNKAEKLLCELVIRNEELRKLVEPKPRGAEPPIGEDSAFCKLIGQRLQLKALKVPKSVPGLEVVAPGWCTPRKSPRRPLLHVPAGTVFIVKATTDVIENILRYGLGVNTRQGWGTVAATCVKKSGEGNT